MTPPSSIVAGPAAKGKEVMVKIKEKRIRSENAVDY